MPSDGLLEARRKASPERKTAVDVQGAAEEAHEVDCLVLCRQLIGHFKKQRYW